MAAAAQAVAPITPNINVNFSAGEEVKMQHNIGPSMNLQIDTDLANRDAGIPPPIPAPMPHMDVQIHDNMGHHNDHVEMNMNIGGMPGMNMEVTGHTTSSATYHQETTVGGVTTSHTTHTTSGIPPPQPAPHIPPPQPAHAEVNMNVGFGGPPMQATATTGDTNATATVGMAGLGMNMNLNVNEENHF